MKNGVKGMVQDIKRNEIGVIIFGKDTGIKEGTKVTRTKKRAGIPVGEGFIGRIVDALGAPIDGKGEIQAEDYRPIEQEAPGIIDRKSVSVPMETGILAIDSHVSYWTWTKGADYWEIVFYRQEKLPLQLTPS